MDRKHERIIMRRYVGVLILGLTGMLAGCSQTDNAQHKTQYMFWPPSPDLPHVQYLTTISSSADVTRKQGDVENFLYGNDPRKGLPFARPYGIRMQDGKMYVCDASVGNLSVLDFRKKEVRVLGATGQVHLAKPIDVAIAPEGSKYVADTGHGAVLVYDSEDKYAGRVSVKDLRPVAVAVHERKLYVSDIAASKVRVFDRFNGKELQEIGEPGGGDGKFGGTMGLCLDTDGNVFVNDVIGCRVQKFSIDGKFVHAFAGLGDHPGQLVRPKLMTVDSTGLIYVVDNASQTVQMFDKDGKTLMFFGGEGSFPGAMDSPAGICVSDSDLDLFAQFVHPAFQAERLICVTNNAGPMKINIYALGELRPGKTLADISDARVKGIYGFDTEAPKDIFDLPRAEDDTPTATEPATQPATQPTTAPATAPLTRPAPIGAQPF